MLQLSRSVTRATRACRSFAAGIDASKLQVIKTTTPQTLPPPDKLTFGELFSDHMLEIDWNADDGWAAPVIKPTQHLSLHPAVCGLHYAVQCFEGAKAYKDEKGQLRTFRLDMNLKRMNDSMTRSGMPGLTEADRGELDKLIRELVRIDSHMVPDAPGYSLYLRPTAIGTHVALGLTPPRNCKWFVITCPVGPYFKTGFKPVQLLASDEYTRAFYGGTGAYKVGANYGTGIMPFTECAKQGFSQILWLLPEGDDFLITEVGTMNLFVSWVNEKGEKELITAPLGELVLPGVTRDSIITISKASGINVAERRFYWSEFSKALSENRVLEVFGAGTAAIVAPVDAISFKGEMLNIPCDKEVGSGPLAKFFYDEISAMQRGAKPSPSEKPWSTII